MKKISVGVILIGLFWLLSKLWMDAPSHPDIKAIDSRNSLTIKEAASVRSESSEQQNKHLSCQRLVENMPSIDSIKRSRSKNMAGFFNHLKKKNIPWMQLDLLAELADMTPGDTLQFLPPRDINIKSFSAAFDFKSASDNEILALETLIENHNLDDIHTIIGEKNNNELYNGFPLFVFLLQKSKKPGIEILNILLAQGLKPSLVDIISATRLRLDDSIINALIHNTEDNENIFWKEGNQPQSLSLIATRQINLSVLTMWLNKSHFNSLIDRMPSELDFLPIPNPSQKTNAIKILKLLLDKGRIMQTRSGYRRLMAWLPKDWIKSNQSYLTLLHEPDIELEADNKEYLSDLKSMLTKYSTQIESVKKITASCPFEVKSKNLKRDNTSFEKKYRTFRKHISQYSRKYELGMLYRLSLKGRIGILRDEIILALNRKDWKTVLDKLSSLLAANRDVGDLALDAAIVRALISNSPEKIIIDLLDLGGKLPPDAILLLAPMGHVKLAEALLSYGLDLYYVNSVGMNAISELIYFPILIEFNDVSDQRQMLLFLLNQGVKIKSSPQGLDALNFALMNIDKSDISANYARILIAHGARIETSHRQQIAKLKIKNIKRYQYIVDLIPELSL